MKLIKPQGLNRGFTICLYQAQVLLAGTAVRKKSLVPFLQSLLQCE